MTTHAALSLEDFLRIPEQQPGLELNPDHSITQKMAPSFPHAELQAHLAYLLRRYRTSALGH